MLELEPHSLTPKKFGAMLYPYVGKVKGYDHRRGLYRVEFPNIWAASNFERDFSCELTDTCSLTAPVESFRDPVQVFVTIDPYWIPVSTQGDDVGVHDIPVPQ